MTEKFSVGDPIDVVTGSNADRQCDLQLLGPVPFRWIRHYDSSRHAEREALGWGHTHHFDRKLQFDIDGIRYLHPIGRAIGFGPLVRDGERATAGEWSIERLGALRYVVRRQDESAYEFEFPSIEGVGLLRFVTDGGAHISFRYDRTGRLQAITDSRGRLIRVEHNGEGLLTGLLLSDPSTGQERRILSYQYDGKGNLVRGTDQDGHFFSFGWDEKNRMIARTDRRGYSFLFAYDSHGRCVHSKGEDGLLEVQLEYRPAEGTTIVTRSDGGRWQYFYEEGGGISRILDPLGGVRSFTRDETGRLVRETDANGEVTRYEYDSFGGLLGKVSPIGLFCRAGDPPAPSYVPHRSPTSSLEWHCGSLLEAADCLPLEPSDPVLSQLPEPIRQIARTLPADDDAGAPTRGEGREVRRFRSEEVFDEFGHLVKERFPDGTERVWNYDANGNVARYHDRDRSTVLYEYVSWNLRRKETDGAGNTAFFWYTNEESLASAIDPGGCSSEYEYDKAGRLARIKRNGLLREEYRYDPAGNLVEKRDGEGQMLLSCSYGPGNQLKVRKLSSGDTHSFEYEEGGRCRRAATAASEVIFTYDERGRRVGDQRDGLGVSHRYNRRELTETTYFARFKVRYRRRGKGVLLITDPTGAEHAFETQRGGFVTRTHPNASTEVAQFDDEGRCVAKVLMRGHSVHRALQYRYSGEGDLLEVRDTARGSTRFRYDGAHRLVAKEPRSGEVQHFEYDRAGNLIRQPDLTTATIRPGNRIGTTNVEEFAYDGRESVVERRCTDGTIRYRYDSRDMLVECRSEKLEWAAEYDALGRRTQKRTRAGTTLFYWDTDRLAAEKRPDGSVRLYVYPDWLSQVPILVVEYSGVGAPPDSGKWFAIYGDHLGCPTLVENQQGETVWSAGIEPYGIARWEARDGFEMPLRFPGHYFDSEISLHYNRFRYYSPELGRYIQPDPAGIGGGSLNLYAYVGGNPLSRVDLRGLACSNEEPAQQPASEDKGDQEETVRLGLGLKSKSKGLDYVAWSKEKGFQTYGELSGRGSFSEQIHQAMTAADEIHFNLKGVDVSKANGTLNDYGEPAAGYTNYELHQIKTNPEFRNKVVFHDENGNPMPKGWTPPGF